MSNHINLGKKGEEITAHYLAKKGYKILEKNWRYKKLEIDLIAKINNILVIVEVKTRNYKEIGNPEEAVTKKKQRFLVDAANAYILEKDLYMDVRFDVVLVILNNGSENIEHIEDAFYPLVR